MNLAVELIELVEIAERLGDSKKRLLIEVARGFLADGEWADDDLTDEDLFLIEAGEKELREGTNPKWGDINWN